MTNEPSPAAEKKIADKHKGMMGDGTEEQDLNQPGTPGARIEKDEVTAAFEKKAPQKSWRANNPVALRWINWGRQLAASFISNQDQNRKSFSVTRAKVDVMSLRSWVIDLNHRTDIGAGELKPGNDRGPEQPSLFFSALDKFVKRFLECLSGRFIAF